MLFGETWCLKSKARAMVIKIDKQHLLQIKKLATQRKCHKEKQQRPQHAAVSNAAAKTSFSALISSPFIFSLALVSPFNFDPSPISSRQFPVRNIRKDEKR